MVRVRDVVAIVGRAGRRGKIRGGSSTPDRRSQLRAQGRRTSRIPLEGVAACPTGGVCRQSDRLPEVEDRCRRTRSPGGQGRAGHHRDRRQGRCDLGDRCTVCHFEFEVVRSARGERVRRNGARFAAPALAPLPLADAPHCAAETNDPLSTETSHCQEYVAVPVDGIVPDTVSNWSASKEVALGVGARGARSAVLTVTVEDAVEISISAVVALSVTFSSKR